MLIQDAIKDYLYQVKVIEGKSINTLKSYSSELNAYLKYFNDIGIRNIEDITYNNISEYLMNRNITSKSINHALSVIKSFHHYISFENTNILNPSILIKSSKVGSKLPNFFHKDDINCLLDSFKDEDDKELFDHTILEVLYASGLRSFELCNLLMNQIHLEQQQIKVKGKGNKERMVPIHTNACSILNDYIGNVRPKFLKRTSSSYVFIEPDGNQLNYTYLSRLIKRKLRECNLNETLTPHSVRHSFATHLLNDDADLRSVQVLLGHSDITTTQLYTHVQTDKLKDSYNSFFPKREDDDNNNVNDDDEEYNDEE
ncbi:MAG: tyrosine-type recombinase/integrase [Erysipelotrichaceae bacterium]